MITVKNWEILKKKQAELDQLIVESSPTDLKWVSRFNAERLKLALLVEVGEFANEIKSFKAWQKKIEINWAKVKEELIDCLGYFLGLCNLYQIKELNYYFYLGNQIELEQLKTSNKLMRENFELSIKNDLKFQSRTFTKKFVESVEKVFSEEIVKLESLCQWINQEEVSFNELLLEFFYKTSDLYVLEVENIYNSESVRYIPVFSYYHWLSVFNKICEKLKINEKELLEIYLRKNKINQQRAVKK